MKTMHGLLTFCLILNINSSIQFAHIVEKKSLDDHLEIDFTMLKTEWFTNSVLKSVTLDDFKRFFYEGIDECLLFLETFNNHISLYQKRVNVLKKVCQRKYNRYTNNLTPSYWKIKKAIRKKSDSGYQLFNLFSGWWYGHWESNFMEHYWLPAIVFKKETIPLKEIHIDAYQTAFTGDGFGWNYQIQIDDKSYIIGFVYHFNNKGNVYIKRPHIGIPQKNKSIIWMTKDHAYYEFIYQNDDNTNSKYYMIVEAEFRNKHLVNTFKASYTNELFPISQIN